MYYSSLKTETEGLYYPDIINQEGQTVQRRIINLTFHLGGEIND